MPEKEKFVPESEEFKINKRQQVNNLANKDNLHENSIYDLAKSEDEFRDDLAAEGLKGQSVDKLANKFSDEVLAKMEANKEKWTDGLTGLRNKKAYQEEIPQLLSMEKRKGDVSSFLMVDFDHFKSINDEYGHLAGDQALKQLAEIINNEVRTSDIVYRFGGEEFIIFLPDTTAELAAKLAERIRAKIEASEIEVFNEAREKVVLKRTVSIGCVDTEQLSDSGLDSLQDLNAMTNYADIAVYAAKMQGRNRVIIFDEELIKE